MLCPDECFQLFHTKDIGKKKFKLCLGFNTSLWSSYKMSSVFNAFISNLEVNRKS